MSTSQRLMIPVLAVALLCGPARADDREQGLYERHGQKGSWAKEVAEALGTYDWSKTESTDALVTAWRQGCRDPLVGYVVLTRYRKQMRAKEAEGVWQQLTEASGASYPGGLYRYGLCPFNMAVLLLAQGKDKEAEERLQQWNEQAQRAGAKRGAAMLRHAQVFVKLNRSMEKALAFWRKHAAELHSVQDETNPREDHHGGVQ